MKTESETTQMSEPCETPKKITVLKSETDVGIVLILNEAYTAFLHWDACQNHVDIFVNVFPPTSAAVAPVLSFVLSLSFVPRRGLNGDVCMYVCLDSKSEDRNILEGRNFLRSKIYDCAFRVWRWDPCSVLNAVMRIGPQASATEQRQRHSS
jgi:hypothetical protein